jgi:hypothetical protein
MSKTDADARTRSLRFRIGDVFDANDPIARWVTVLAMAMNNTIYVNVRLIEGDGQSAAGQVLPPELNLYYFRLLASHFYEAVTWLRDTRRCWPEINAFIGSLDPRFQHHYEVLVAFADSNHVLHQQLRRCRMSMFHYPRMNQDRERRGIEDLANAMREAADIETAIEGGEDYASFRATFADEISTQFLAPTFEEAKQVFEGLQQPMIELVEFGEAALLAHLKRIDTKKIVADEAAETLSPASAALAAVDLLVVHAKEHVVPNLSTEGNPYERAILVALFARSLPLTQAIVRLGHEGFGREALMLNRPLFELMIDAHWADANRDLASERFIQHARFTQHLQRETAVRYPTIFGTPSPLETLSDDELKSLRRTFGKFGHKSWTGLSTLERVASIQERFDDAGDRRQLMLASEILNAASNAELHPSPWSLGRALRRVTNVDGGERLQFRAAPEPELVGIALRQSWWIFGQLLNVMHTAAGLAKGGLLDAGDAGHALIEAAGDEADAG